MTAPLWLTQAAADVPADDGWLSAAERDRLAALRVPKRRADWRLGRWAAKRALAAALGLGPEALPALEVRAAEDGVPEAFVEGAPAPLALSLSHREGLALAVVARAAALGCDLELVEPRSDAFLADYLAPTEQALVAAAEAERALLANLVWTGKESALKALRGGLRLDPRRAVVRLPESPDREGWRPLEVRLEPEGRAFRGWWRREGGFVLSVVADPPPGLPVRLGAPPQNSTL